MQSRNTSIAFLILSFLLPFIAVEGVNEYLVRFTGIEEKKTLELLESASQLNALKKHPPKTPAALRRRAEADIPNLIKALHSKAYYNAKIEFTIDLSVQPTEIVYHIDPGPIYPLGQFNVLPGSFNIQPQQLGIVLDQPAYPKDILAAEEALIAVMAQMGYPLAQIEDREVLADQESKQIFVTIRVNSGPLTYFGETTITGNSDVLEAFVRKKIQWCKGKRYDPAKIDCTVNALEAAGLFSSINITHPDEATSENTLPMTIHVSEGKMRSIGIGIGYSTQRGPGFTAEWEHRNYRGMGEKLRFDTNVLQHTQEASLLYIIPDFRCRAQDLLWAAELQHDDTEGFEVTSLSFSGILERQLSERTRVSFGGMYQFLQIAGSDHDGSYNLIKAPLQYKWSNADDPLDPTCGAMIYFKTVPTVQLLDPQFAYLTNTLTASIYRPPIKRTQLCASCKS